MFIYKTSWKRFNAHKICTILKTHVCAFLFQFSLMFSHTAFHSSTTTKNSTDQKSTNKSTKERKKRCLLLPFLRTCTYTLLHIIVVMVHLLRNYRYCMIHQFYYCLTNTGLNR